MIVFIKNLGIVLCMLYCCNVLMQRTIKKIDILIGIIYAIICSVATVIIEKHIPQCSIIFITLMMIIYGLIINNEKLLDCFILIIVSFLLSYVSFFFSVTLVTTIIAIPIKLLYGVDQFLTMLIQLILIFELLKIKRIRHGIIVLKNLLYRMPEIIIALGFLIFAVKTNGANFTKGFIIYPIIGCILSILLFLYWRTSITRHYLERLSLRNIDSLNAELVEKTNYIKALEEDKARIEKLNHKNYKLVPAMEGAVMHYLDGVKSFVESNADNPAFAEFAASKEMDMTGFIDEGNRLLGELNKMLAEWEDVVHNDDIDGKKDLPVCGVTRVDYILSYMYERSLKENFVLKVDVDSALTGLTEKIITDEDLGTLIADLIENAIIATRCNNGKDILVRLGMMKKEYTIEVYDSGIPFDKEVLAKYGYEQITTHADESGSGIGMMQTYEILSKCGASLFIDEFAEGEGMYTKRISVVFNKKHQYVLYTKRSDEEVAYLKKRSDLMIVRK